MIRFFGNTYLGPLAAGIMVGTSYIPFPPWALRFCLVPLFVFWHRQTSIKASLWGGFITGFVLSLIGFNWVAYVAHEFGGLHWALAIGVLFVFCCAGNIYFSLAGGVYQLLGRLLKGGLDHPYLSTFTMAVVLALFEQFYVSIFKWNLAYPLLWVDLYSAQLAELIGMQGLSSILILLQGMIAGWWLTHGAALCRPLMSKFTDLKNECAHPPATNKVQPLAARLTKALAAPGGVSFKTLWPLCFVLLVIVGGELWGWYLQQRVPAFDAVARVLMVQANIGNDDKVTARVGRNSTAQKRSEYIVDKYVGLTQKALNSQKSKTSNSEATTSNGANSNGANSEAASSEGAPSKASDSGASSATRPSVKGRSPSKLLPLSFALWPETAYPRNLKRTSRQQNQKLYNLVQKLPIVTGGYAAKWQQRRPLKTNINTNTNTDTNVDTNTNSSVRLQNKDAKLKTTSRSNQVYKSTNALFVLQGEGGQVYNKKHLLVFGEYIPFSSRWPQIKKYIPAADFARGEGAKVIPLKNANTIGITTNGTATPLVATSGVATSGVTTNGTNTVGTRANKVTDLILGPFICYEALFAVYVARIASLGAQLLINITNDSWYGDWQEPYQHSIMSLARAIETRRPVLRATNTGISTVMLATGQQLRASPLHKEWSHIYEVPYHTQPRDTFYQRYPYFVALLMILALLITWSVSLTAARPARS